MNESFDRAIKEYFQRDFFNEKEFEIYNIAIMPTDYQIGKMKSLWKLTIPEQIDKYMLLFGASTTNSHNKIDLPRFTLPRNWEVRVNRCNETSERNRKIFQGIKYLKDKDQNDQPDSDFFCHFVRIYMAHFVDNKKRNLFETFSFDRDGFWRTVNSLVPGGNLLLLVLEVNEEVILRENLVNLYW